MESLDIESKNPDVAERLDSSCNKGRKGYPYVEEYLEEYLEIILFRILTKYGKNYRNFQSIPSCLYRLDCVFFTYKSATNKNNLNRYFGLDIQFFSDTASTSS